MYSQTTPTPAIRLRTAEPHHLTSRHVAHHTSRRSTPTLEQPAPDASGELGERRSRSDPNSAPDREEYRSLALVTESGVPTCLVNSRGQRIILKECPDSSTGSAWDTPSMAGHWNSLLPAQGAAFRRHHTSLLSMSATGAWLHQFLCLLGQIRRAHAQSPRNDTFVASSSSLADEGDICQMRIVDPETRRPQWDLS